MNQSKFPPGWDEARVKSLIAEYDELSDEEWAAADEAALSERNGESVMVIPDALLPAVRALLAAHLAQQPQPTAAG